MIENIKFIKDRKGLKAGTTLNDLGKINVICGRNSSGKSTILESIRETEYRATSFRIDEAICEELVALTMNSFERQNIAIGTRVRLKPGLEQSLRIHLSGRTLFRDEIEVAMNGVRKDCNDIGYGPLMRAPIEEMRRNLEERWPKFTSMLVPPKRAMADSASVQFQGSTSADGREVLNVLFSIKNSTPGTEESSLYERIKGAFGKISSGFDFNIVGPTGHLIVLQISEGNGKWTDAKDCGLGLLEVLAMVYYSLASKEDMVLIEEPENHMHPEMQRRFLEFLKHEPGLEKQFILTTHSNVFVNHTLVDRTFLSKFDGQVTIEDESNRAAILNNLGYSVIDNLLSELIILVEGPSDAGVINEFLNKIGLLESYRIRIWPLGGNTMEQVDLSAWADFPRIALIDRDPGSEEVRKRFVDKCQEAGVEVARLRGYAIENYFSVRALKVVLGERFPEGVTAINLEDRLDKQIGRILPKKDDWKVAKAMTLDEIGGTDFEEFLSRVKVICQSKLASAH
jgi:ABC-type polar amino acid transport system ATPase subunit